MSQTVAAWLITELRQLGYEDVPGCEGEVALQKMVYQDGALLYRLRTGWVLGAFTIAAEVITEDETVLVLADSLGTGARTVAGRVRASEARIRKAWGRLRCVPHQGELGPLRQILEAGS